MYLHSIQIKGFRKLQDVKVILSNTTFLIGANNSGKSSILKAIEFLLSDTKVCNDDFYKSTNESASVDEIELEGEFRGIPQEAIGDKDWKGFTADRVLRYYDDVNKKWDYRIFYKKVFTKDGKTHIFMKQHTATPKEKFASASTYNDLVDLGLNLETLQITKDDIHNPIRKSKKIVDDLYQVSEFWDYSDTEEWFENPGGFASNVISKLPRLLLIPPYDKSEEYNEKKGALFDILNELFEEVRRQSEHYKKALEHLKNLEQEFNPQDSTTEFGKMISELNSIIKVVFPSANLNAQAQLTSADTLKPNYTIELGSNINTKPQYQGTGQLRAAVFALLRYKAERDKQKNSSYRPLIIGFEEPELYLHPQAAYQMKEVIYDLSSKNQIICSTHSPYMIDLSKNHNQILNKLHIRTNDHIEQVKIIPFNISADYLNLLDEERNYLKMLLKMDDEVSKIFFSKKVLIIEGDTEEIVIKQYINLLPKEQRDNLLSEWSILKARGKATIISVIKYLKAMSFKEIKVMHDLDENTPDAAKFNVHIQNALDNDANLFPIKNCIEDLLGYVAPIKDKPFMAYKKTLEWGSFDDIPPICRNVFDKIFDISI